MEGYVVKISWCFIIRSCRIIGIVFFFFLARFSFSSVRGGSAEWTAPRPSWSWNSWAASSYFRTPPEWMPCRVAISSRPMFEVHLTKVQFSASSSELMRKWFFASLNVQEETNRNFHRKFIYWKCFMEILFSYLCRKWYFIILSIITYIWFHAVFCCFLSPALRVIKAQWRRCFERYALSVFCCSHLRPAIQLCKLLWTNLVHGVSPNGA